jgi:anti-anti-sigma factor
MAFHFVAHNWEVRNVSDGMMVRISPQELDPNTIAVLDEELIELVRESGHSNLYVDLRDVRFLTNSGVGKFVSLDAMLRKMDCRLILCNLDPLLQHSLQTSPLGGHFDVRAIPGPEMAQS